MSNLVFCLMGPTASGKTALAGDLFAQYPLELISVDSAMIYQDMNIGTAKPSPLELKLIPHHLIDIRTPEQSYSAADFCADTIDLCQKIIQKGKIPFLVGGSMMYFNALQKGLAVLPEADETIRLQIEEEALALGWPHLHQKLSSVDPITAMRIHTHDTQRIQRALEVYYLTGSPLSTQLSAQKKESPYRFINLVLFPQDRAWLHQRIAQRFNQMLTDGLVGEVSDLQKKWHLNLQLPSMRCVGYRQILHYLQGECDYQMMIDKGIAATRQLAKRQLTWLRQWENALVYDPQEPTFSAEIIAKVGEILDNEHS